MNTPLGELRRIVERYGIRDLYVFGSRAEEIAALVAGRAPPGETPTSDVDIGIQPIAGSELSPRDRVRLADELERLFDAPRVDLVLLPEAGAFLAAEIVCGELLLTADSLAQAEHELYILRRSADLAPFRRERVRQILTEGAR